MLGMKVAKNYIKMSRKQTRYHIAACFDTETTNILKYDSNGNVIPNETRAICILYIFNDLRMKNLKEYEPGKDDKVSFLRTEEEAQSYIDDMVTWGRKARVVPIICAYNLMFDLQTLMYELNIRYDMKVNAQSSTNVYTLDLFMEDELVLRFWDTYHLEMRGLAAMGETCGLEKAKGDWDYSLVRTSQTPLTDEELFYATRDVQVIPAYLKYLLNANEWLKQYDLGSKVLTKTSLVRQMAQRKIGIIKINKRNGKPLDLRYAFMQMCKRQLPRDYESYAIRKACFRGGFTFTSARFANEVVENVVSMDVTSMHHAFINGRYVPVDFDKDDEFILQTCIDNVLSKTVDDVLERYHKPFVCAFHMEIYFENIRLKKGSCFEKWQIGLIPMGKFRIILPKGAEYGLDERARYGEEVLRRKGFHDKCIDPVFAFGKLYSAESCVLFLTELELWCIAQVYEWDFIRAIRGESTVKWDKPPDYVTLQSNNLFEMKNDAKIINKNYKQGIPYELEIPDTIPTGIANSLKDGTCDAGFFESYYNSTVKGMFNGIYGTMAQDVFKPSYAVREGELFVDGETSVNEENYEDKKPRQCKVLYTYGMRIVGGSRMHLVIALILLYSVFGEKIAVTGGDTDSIKMRVDESIEDEELLSALEPLHKAVENAIDYTMIRVRDLYPNMASTLNHIGKFEIEKCAGFDRWKYHLEAWNKARVSIAQDGHVHITCAGLSRPIGYYTIENFIEDLLDMGYKPEVLLPMILGYNVYVTHDLCFALEHKNPDVNDYYDGFITDYLGNEYEVHQKEAIALYESGRLLGDTNKKTNYDNVEYLKSIGKLVYTGERWLTLKEGKPQIIDVEGVLYGKE